MTRWEVRFIIFVKLAQETNAKIFTPFLKTSFYYLEIASKNLSPFNVKSLLPRMLANDTTSKN
jgi:hypothetical protein